MHKQQLLNKAQTKIQQRTEKSDITSSSGDEVDNDCKSPPEKIRGAELIVSFSRSLIKVKNNDMDSDGEFLLTALLRIVVTLQRLPHTNMWFHS